jgi:hypothetical protein
MKSSVALEGVQRVKIDCSTEIIEQVRMDLTTRKMENIPSRRTHFSIPINSIKKHVQIPDDTGSVSFLLSVIAEGRGDYKFKDTVSVPITSKGGILRVDSPFGVPWREVPADDLGKQIKDVKCYLVM